MHFICQIALDLALFGKLPTRLAYLFMTDWDYESVYPEAFIRPPSILSAGRMR
jgi:hypothetical protein